MNARGKEELYKKRSQGLASREVRAKLKAQERKTKRDDLLASKRRIPLSVLQEEPRNSPNRKKLSKQEQSALRLEKLKEWKKAKEEAKMKSTKAKKPFGFGVLKSSTSFQPGDQKNIFLSRPQPAAPKLKDRPIDSSKPPKSVQKAIVVAPKPSTKPVFRPSQPAANSSKSMSANKTCKQTPKPPLNSKERKGLSAPASKKPRGHPAPASKQPKGHPAPVNKQPKGPISKQPKEYPAKPKEGTAKSVPSRPQTRSMTKSAVSKVKAESKESCQTNVKRVKQNTKAKLPERLVTTHSPSKSVTSDTVEMMDITVEISNPAPSDEGEGGTSPPITPPRLRKYDPVTPSPLLRSRSAKRRETQYSAPRAVIDPAWIPGHPNNQELPQLDFDQEFRSFSPFQFGKSGSKPVEFTFRKELSFSNDSLEDVSSQQIVSPSAKVVRRSLGSSCTHSPSRNVSMTDDALIVEVANDGPSNHDEEMATERSESPAGVPAVSGIDIGYFRKLHSDVTETLTALCTVWEEKAARLEGEESDGGSMEEVLGQLRTTVGQARLLMRQKLKQYLGLVDTAETQSGERKTTAEDLQGFWDMVSFQVEDVYTKFHGLETIEKNGWTLKAPTPKKKKTTKKRVAKKSAANPVEESERARAAREKREAQRKKLMEMKMASKRAREEPVCEQENVPTTPKKSRIDQLSPQTGSGYKNGRRQSLRLRNRSIFSPAPCPTHDQEQPALEPSAIPVATLISFD